MIQRHFSVARPVKGPEGSDCIDEMVGLGDDMLGQTLPVTPLRGEDLLFNLCTSRSTVFSAEEHVAGEDGGFL
jgi:hypothetical protein